MKAVILALSRYKIKVQKKFWGFNGIWTHHLSVNTHAMPYQLTYEVSLETGQVRVQFVPERYAWREWHDVYMINIIWASALQIKNTSESEPRSYEVITYKAVASNIIIITEKDLLTLFM